MEDFWGYDEYSFHSFLGFKQFFFFFFFSIKNRVFHNIPHPSKLDSADYYFFRAGRFFPIKKNLFLQINKKIDWKIKGINPVWEDKVFEKGGASLDLSFTEMNKQDEIFKYVLLSSIGETIESSSTPDVNFVAGIRIQIRKKGFKINIWVSDLNQKEQVKQTAYFFFFFPSSIFKSLSFFFFISKEKVWNSLWVKSLAKFQIFV